MNHEFDTFRKNQETSRVGMNHEFDTFRQNQETSRVGMNHEFDTFRKNCVEENTQLLILIYSTV